MVTAFFVFLFRWRRFKLRERITPQTAVSAYRNKSTLPTSASIKPVYQTMLSDPPIMIECSCAGKLGSNLHQFWPPRATRDWVWGGDVAGNLEMLGPPSTPVCQNLCKGRSVRASPSIRRNQAPAPSWALTSELLILTAA